MDDSHWRAAAISLFNEAKSYIDLETRSQEEDRMMLATALGSLACWRKVGDEKNFSVSDWQVSRVYALIGDADLARIYGESALGFAKTGALEPFYVGFAYESLARAAFVAGDVSLARRHIASATARAGNVADVRDRQLLDTALADLESLLPGAP